MQLVEVAEALRGRPDGPLWVERDGVRSQAGTISGFREVAKFALSSIPALIYDDIRGGWSAVVAIRFSDEGPVLVLEFVGDGSSCLNDPIPDPAGL